MSDINYDKGSPAYNSSYESTWLTVASNGAVHDPASRVGTYWNPDVDASIVFNKPSEGVSTLLLRYTFADVSGLTVTGPQVIVFGRTSSDGGATFGPWMVLSNRDGEDGIVTAISLPGDFTNFATDGNIRFGAVDSGTQWFDTMGCTQFAIAVRTASSASGDGGATEVGQSIQAKWL